jgi:hypothetical protein
MPTSALLKEIGVNKTVRWNSLVMGLVFALSGSLSGRAEAQSSVQMFCEQGHFNSWKICEVTEGYPRYVWTASGVAAIDPYVCTENSNVCTAWCPHTTSAGSIHVTVYNSSGQPVRSLSRSLGCGAG